MLTLQQYFNNAQQPPPDEPDVGAPESEPEPEEPPPRVIGPEDSVSMRNTLAVHEATKAAKAAAENNES